MGGTWGGWVVCWVGGWVVRGWGRGVWEGSGGVGGGGTWGGVRGVYGQGGWVGRAGGWAGGVGGQLSLNPHFSYYCDEKKPMGLGRH